jgi:hypothetical protein
MIRAAYIRDFITHFCRNQFGRELQPAHVPPGRTGPSQKSFSFPLITLVMMRIAGHRRCNGQESEWGAVASFGAASRGNVHLAEFAAKLG